MLITTLLVLCLIIFIAYWKWAFQYWHRRNIPYLEPTIPFGNLTESFTGNEHYVITLKKLYDKMKAKGWKKGGIYLFGKPHYFPLDLDQVKNIFTRDFQYFVDRDLYFEEDDPFLNNLTNHSGDNWRILRSKLTPTFTSEKIKMMFQVMANCIPLLHKRMDEEIDKMVPIHIREILACFSTDIIGTCAFGLDFKTLENENSVLRAVGRKILTTSRWKLLKLQLATAYPRLAKFLRFYHSDKEAVEFVKKLVEDTVNYRETNNITRNDFLQLLIGLKNQPRDDGEKPLTMKEMVSQCYVFFVAGFESTSSLITFVLYELSKNQDVQNRLRAEIGRFLSQNGDQITYDSLQGMKYLNQVIDESLRLHPPIPLLIRKCVKDYKDSDLVLERGTVVNVSVMGIHYDPDYYPDPTRFDPERFSDLNKSLRHPYAHLAFGHGPRNCIGMRFGLVQAKLGLVALLRNYQFNLNGKTQEPLTYKKAGFVLEVEGEVWLDARRI